jgi:tRNA pseudouridine55 synthase
MIEAGFININKPKDWTSHDVVAKLRRLLDIRKIGHAGTLDPFATGVLPLAIGNCTRLMRFLKKTKKYTAEIDFSFLTDTDDYTGEAFADLEQVLWSEEALLEELKAFEGTQKQIPPLYSAIKHKGKRLYELMRSNAELDVEEIKSKTITIYSIELLAFKYPKATIDVSCSEGTYIRSIARDLGGHLSSLERTESNGFTIDKSLSLEFIEKNLGNISDFIVAAKDMLDLPAVELNSKESIDLQQGKKIHTNYSFKIDNKEQFVQCLDPTQELIGLANISSMKEDKILLQPKVIL